MLEWLVLGVVIVVGLGYCVGGFGGGLLIWCLLVWVGVCDFVVAGCLVFGLVWCYLRLVWASGFVFVYWWFGCLD